jgi:signal transduction histidine kinase
MEKIFDPYFTTKEEGKGTGMGLYMSKVIVEKNMQGKLRVNNSLEGAEFTIVAPLRYNPGDMSGISE